MSNEFENKQDAIEHWQEQGWLHKPFNVEFTLVVEKDGTTNELPARLENVLITNFNERGYVIEYGFDGIFYQTEHGNWQEPSDSDVNKVYNANRIKTAIEERYKLLSSNDKLKHEFKCSKGYYHNLEQDEPMFMLRGNDKSSGKVVLLWIVENYDNLNASNKKLQNAFDDAMQLRSYGFTNGRNAD